MLSITSVTSDKTSNFESQQQDIENSLSAMKLNNFISHDRLTKKREHKRCTFVSNESRNSSMFRVHQQDVYPLFPYPSQV